jgi:tartronate-semialdehyde synthase
MLNRRTKPLIVAGGGIINADASDLLIEFAEITGVPVDPHPDGLGHDPRRPPAHGRHVRPADQRTATATPPCWPRDFVLGVGNRWANRHTGSVETYTKGRKFVHVDIEPTQIGRVFAPDLRHRL